MQILSIRGSNKVSVMATFKVSIEVNITTGLKYAALCAIFLLLLDHFQTKNAVPMTFTSGHQDILQLINFNFVNRKKCGHTLRGCPIHISMSIAGHTKHLDSSNWVCMITKTTLRSYNTKQTDQTKPYQSKSNLTNIYLQPSLEGLRSVI